MGGRGVCPFTLGKSLDAYVQVVSRLSCISGQVTSRSTTQPKVEGWMIHFLLSDPERRLKHYWILANDAINMYNEYNEGETILLQLYFLLRV